MPTIFVDSAESLQLFMRELIDQVENSTPKTLYLDLEGIKLSRNGTVSILTLLLNDGGFHPDHVCLIDIRTLGCSAFTAPSMTSAANDNRRKTQKDLLESPTETKVTFDVRNDQNALFSHYGIRMQGIMDLQLMENAARKGSPGGKRLVYGLAKRIMEDSDLSEVQKKTWKDTKQRGRRLFAPELGGCYEIFNERPLKEEN